MKTTLAALTVLVCTAASYGQVPVPALQPQPGGQIGNAVQASGYLGMTVELNGQGLLVQSANFGTPAGSAGLENGDLVVAADGQMVNSLDRLESMLRNSFGAITLTVRDIRTGRFVAVTMRKPAGNNWGGGNGGGGGNWGGGNGGGNIGNPIASIPGLYVEVEILSGGRYKIRRILQNSVAREIGLTVGDIIVRVNGYRAADLPNPTQAYRQSFVMVYDDAETGFRYTLRRNVW